MINNITTIIIRNDALESIDRDKDFGKNLVNAIKSNNLTNKQVDIQASGHINAATVVEQHPHTEVRLVAVGYNYGSVFCDTKVSIEHHTPESKILILREIVNKFGYFLKKRSKTWDKS